MNKKADVFLITGFIIATFLLGIALAQSEHPAAATQAEHPAAPETAVSTEPEMQWLWGEVVSVDAARGQIIVKYLDYDTDTEKQMEITTDAKTVFENVKSIDEVKPQDTVSIDYSVTAEGKNIAGMISVEKIEIENNPQALEEAQPEAAVMQAVPQEAPQGPTQ